MSRFDRGQYFYDRAVAVFYFLFGAMCAVSAITDIVDVVWDLTHTGTAHLAPLVNVAALPAVAHPTALRGAVLWLLHLPRLPVVLLFCAFAARTGIERWATAGLPPRDAAKDGS